MPHFSFLKPIHHSEKIFVSSKRGTFFLYSPPPPVMGHIGPSWIQLRNTFTRVADPDPFVFGPPGSGSISRMYGSGSGSLYHQPKIVRKTLIPSTFLILHFDFLSLKNDVNVPSKVISRKTFFILVYWWRLERSMTKIAGSGLQSGSIPKCHGSATLPFPFYEHGQRLTLSQSRSLSCSW